MTILKSNATQDRTTHSQTRDSREKQENRSTPILVISLKR